MRLTEDNICEFLAIVIARQTDQKHRVLKIERILSGYEPLMAVGLARAYGKTDPHGNPSGFLLGINFLEPLNGELMAFEHLFLVVPGSGETAASLLDEFESGARADGCKKIVVGCHKEFKPKVLERWYRKLGFSWVSSSFEKSVQ